ncbi:NHL repeat-containing protein [Synechococcus sp. JA-3-3Ab]|uniref:NHL repeat-containing protein n=1 Tax=Synechococcus sp. (strain JA-3-3Ab) TaxID=321327 RepID=UPI0011D0D7E4|nr:NHL repeat-containing protein [Synechococcus sp. JA-3-3Ab]
MPRRASPAPLSLPALSALVLALSACGELSSSNLSPSVVSPSALQPVSTPTPLAPAALTLEQARQSGLAVPNNRIVLLLQEQGSDLVAQLPASEVDRWLARTPTWPGVEGIDLSITLGSYRQTANAPLRLGQPATFTFTNPPAGEAELSAIAYRGSTTLAQGKGSLTLSARSGGSGGANRRLSMLVLSGVEVPLLHTGSGVPAPGQPLLLSGENLERAETVLFASAANPERSWRGEIRSRSNDRLTVMPPASLAGTVWVAVADAAGQGLGTLVYEWPAPTPSPTPTAAAASAWRVETLLHGRTSSAVNPGNSASDSGGESRLSLGQIGGIAVDPEGFFYLADPAQHRIFRLSPEGELEVWAGSGKAGHRDGAADQAQFDSPQGLLWDPKGGLWVADSGNHCLRHISRQRQVTTFAGTCVAGYRDGERDEAQFREPFGLALGLDGSLYVADRANRRIRRITPTGKVTTAAGTGQPGSADGPADQAQLLQPTALAVDREGNLWIADRHRLRRLSADGQLTTLSRAEAGYRDGPLAEARFQTLAGLAFDSAGILWLADRDNHRLRRLQPNGQVSTLAGQDEPGWQDGPASVARFEQPGDLLVLPDGSVVVVDAGLPGLRRLSRLLPPPATPVSRGSP